MPKCIIGRRKVLNDQTKHRTSTDIATFPRLGSADLASETLHPGLPVVPCNLAQERYQELSLSLTLFLGHGVSSPVSGLPSHGLIYINREPVLYIQNRVLKLDRGLEPGFLRGTSYPSVPMDNDSPTRCGRHGGSGITPCPPCLILERVGSSGFRGLRDISPSRSITRFDLTAYVFTAKLYNPSTLSYQLSVLGLH